jgi:hypothetical protein
MTDRLTEIGRCYGMEINLGKDKVLGISRQPSAIQITIDQKQPDNVDYFRYLSNMLTNNASGIREIKSWIAMAKAAFNQNNYIFMSKLD